MSYGIGPATWGADVWAGVLSTAEAPTSGLHVVVAGVNVSDYVQLDSFSVEEELNGRSQASMRLTNDDLTLRLWIGQPITCRIDGRLVFAGTIESIDEAVPDTTTTIIYEIECVDFNQLADRHYVANKFATTGQTMYDVVTLINNTYSGDAGERLVDEGVFVDGQSVQTGPVLGTIVFSYQTVAEAFDDLAQLTGFWWSIDYNKKLNFVDRATYRAPRDLDEATWQAFRRVKVTRGRDQYRNLQVLRAGKDITTARVERFKGDGEKRSFEMSLPVADKPSQIKVNAGVIAQGDIGVRQKDEGKKWYYQVDDKGISQDSSETVLSTSDVLEVTYQGFFPIIMLARQDTEIDDRQQVEGGTGIYSHVESDESINDDALAEEKVNSLLRRYANIPDEVSFVTSESGFQSGQILRVNLPEHQLSGEFLITAVELGFVGYDDDQNEVYGYSVRAVDGEFLGGWADFFKRLSKKGRPFTIRENEEILLIRQNRDVISITDTVGTADALGAYTIDAGSTILIGAYPFFGFARAVSTEDAAAGFVSGPRVGIPEHIGVS